MIELRSMAVTMPEVAGHPNRVAFRGVLTTVDVPSQRAPSGAKGHLVVLTKQAAEAALPSLLGMALDYSPSLDRHDVRRKVGVITRAEIVGRELELGGYLFARDFPEIVQEIEKSQRGNGQATLASCSGARSLVRTMHAGIRRGESGDWGEVYRFRSLVRTSGERIQRLAKTMLGTSQSHRTQPKYCPTIRAETCISTAGAGGLGLSYEVTDVQLADPMSQVWKLEKVTFTGAAILRRDKAAYQDTWIELGS